MNTKEFFNGFRDAIPIGLGYLVVSFSLGIAAGGAGLNVLQSFLASLLCAASAGEYAGFTLIAANASLVEMAAMMLVVNARYLLMSCAMSQKMSPSLGLGHRLLMGLYNTDEIFALTVLRRSKLNPFYSYGAAAAAIPPWAVGSALGTLAGNVLPVRLVSALGVALYGMFLAVIIPPMKKDRVIAGLVPVCFAASLAAEKMSALKNISSGTRVIILTVLISGAAALLFPREDEL